MKIHFLLTILTILIISSYLAPLISAQNIQELSTTLTDSDIPDKIEGSLEKVKEFTEADKWDFLSQKWKELLLKNKAVSQIDTNLKKISPAFFFLFGEPYSLSLTLLITIVLWLFFFYTFGIKIFAEFSAFSKPISYILGFALATISAQIGIYRKLSIFIFKIIFYKSGIWTWLSAFGLLILCLAIIALIKSLSKSIKKEKEKQEKAQEKKDRKTLRKTAEAIKEGLEKEGSGI